MVSTEKYLRTFFAVMPQRFKELQQLKEEKTAIDKRILAGRKLGINDFARLMEIIGHDTLFHPKAKKKTLKHIVWKLQKSLEKLSGIRQKAYVTFEGPYYALRKKERYPFKPDTSKFDPAVTDRLMQAIDRFMEYVEQNAKKIAGCFEELHRNYDMEYYVLSKCRDYDSTLDLEEYKNFYLKKERELAKSVKSSAVVFQQVSSDVIGKARIFANYLRAKSGLLKWTKAGDAVLGVTEAALIIFATGFGFIVILVAAMIGLALHTITGGMLSWIDVELKELPTWYQFFLPILEMSSPVLIKAGIDMKKYDKDLLLVTQWLKI